MNSKHFSTIQSNNTGSYPEIGDNDGLSNHSLPTVPTAQPFLPGLTFSTSPALNQDNLKAERLCLSAAAYLRPPLSTHTLIFIMDQPIVMSQRRDGKLNIATLKPGQVLIAPAWHSSECSWSVPLNVLSIRLEHSFIVEMARQLGVVQAEQLEILNSFGTYSPQLEAIGQLIQKELLSPSPMVGSQLCSDLLANLLAVYLIRHHSNVAAKSGQLSSERPVAELPLGTEPLKRVIEYIKANLEQELSLKELAKVVGVSSYHFARQFKKSVGLTPHQYLIQVRIERAKQLLLETNLTVKEVAVQSGFYDQGHLARHFKKLLGVSPKQIQSNRYSAITGV